MLEEIYPISITSIEDGKKIALKAPFHPDCADNAKSIGGRYNRDRGWVFDAQDEARVRQLAREIWGTDGSHPVPTLTVLVNLDEIDADIRSQELWLFGRRIAYRPRRDAKVVLGAGVIIVHGGFQYRGGSMRYPELAPKDGTILEVRYVPHEHKDLRLPGITVKDGEIPDQLTGDELIATLRDLVCDLWQAAKHGHPLPEDITARMQRAGITLPENHD